MRDPGNRVGRRTQDDRRGLVDRRTHFGASEHVEPPCSAPTDRRHEVGDGEVEDHCAGQHVGKACPHPARLPFALQRPSRAVRSTPRDSLGERRRTIDDQHPLHIGSPSERLEDMRIASPEAFDLKLSPVVEGEG